MQAALAMDTDIKGMIEGIVRRFRAGDKEAPHEGTHHLLELGGPAPDFEAQTTHGPIRLSTWKPDDWVLLFSHPADFTPVCTTEFVGFARRFEDFRKRGVALLGNSVDSIYAHIAWTRNIKQLFDVDIPFPVIADLDQKVSRLYGMLHEASSNTSAVRAVYFIDPKRTIRAMIYYPLNVGRSIDEVLRVVDGLQMVDSAGVAAPANWRPGDPVIVPPPATSGEAEERMHLEGADVRDWYFATRRMEAETRH